MRLCVFWWVEYKNWQNSGLWSRIHICRSGSRCFYQCRSGSRSRCGSGSWANFTNFVKKLPYKVLKKTRKILHKLKIMELVHIYFILLNKRTIITNFPCIFQFFPQNLPPWIRIHSAGRNPRQPANIQAVLTGCKLNRYPMPAMGYFLSFPDRTFFLSLDPDQRKIRIHEENVLRCKYK